MIQQTSLEAYKAIIPELAEKQKIVFDVIYKHPGMSNYDISQYLGWRINSVTPRVNELRELGFVDLHSFKEDSITHRNVMTWEVI